MSELVANLQQLNVPHPMEPGIRVEFVDTIPKSPSGKILRKDLRAREGAGSTAPCSAR